MSHRLAADATFAHSSNSPPQCRELLEIDRKQAGASLRSWKNTLGAAM